MNGLPRFDGPENMRRDADLLSAAEQGVVGWRVYGWDGPWVSLGRYQRPETALRNSETIRWVIRPTGGKAVLHGHDVTVGLAVPLSHFGGEVRHGPRSLRAVYQGTIAPIVAALRSCGMPAILAGDLPISRGERGAEGESEGVAKLEPNALTPTLSRGERGLQTEGLADCFAVTSPNDVVHEISRAKVCGCALRVTRSAVLVQASIPAGEPLIDPAEVYDSPAALSLYPWRPKDFAQAFEREMDAFLADRSPGIPTLK